MEDGSELRAAERFQVREELLRVVDRPLASARRSARRRIGDQLLGGGDPFIQRGNGPRRDAGRRLEETPEQ